MLSAQANEECPVPDDGHEIVTMDALCHLTDALWTLISEQFLGLPEMATLTLAQLRLLYTVHEHHLVTSQEVSSISGLTPITAKRLLKKLIRRGLVKRCMAGDDANTVLYRMSDTGLSLIKRLDEDFRRRCRGMFGRLTCDERRILVSYLDLFINKTS